jgi:hypothetical protein
MILPSNERCYERLAAEPDSAAARQFAFLKRFSDERRLLERGFDANLATQFHELYWELYLAAALDRFGLAVSRGTGKCEPDYRVRRDGLTIFIEAVASNVPKNPDNLVRPAPNSTDSDFEEGIAPDAAILQRLAQCLDEKIGKLNRPAAVTTIKAAGDSCVVIALNGNRAINGHPHDDVPIAVPFVVRAVFGLVDEWINEGAGIFWRQSAAMQKGERTFPVGHFDQGQWRDPSKSVRHIAGVLFSKATAWHTAGQPGDDFLFVQNPHGPDLTKLFRFCPRGVWIRDHETIRKNSP